MDSATFDSTTLPAGTCVPPVLFSFWSAAIIWSISIGFVAASAPCCLGALFFFTHNFMRNIPLARLRGVLCFVPMCST
eukprot:4380526-Pyramimonas_sp.AAC.1